MLVDSDQMRVDKLSHAVNFLFSSFGLKRVYFDPFVSKFLSLFVPD